MSADWTVIERVTKRARSKAWFHAGFSAIVAAMLMLTSGGTLTMILVGMNVLSVFFLARRALRLRASGPVMTALRDRPQDIASIHEWPSASHWSAAAKKQPAKRPPPALEIRTHAGALASVFLDAKQPGESAALVAALRTRSPDAVVVYPAIHVA